MLWEYITPSMEASVRFWPIAAYHLLKLNVRFQYKADPQVECSERPLSV